jgi:galactokinase
MPLGGADPPVRLLVHFQQLFPEIAPDYILQAPGRDIWLAGIAAAGETYTIHAPDVEGRTEFTCRTAKAKRTVLNRPLPKWARYPAGVALALQQAGLSVPGVAAVAVGEEPVGLRYDYALGMAFAALWHELLARPYTSDSLIELCEWVRREYVET